MERFSVLLERFRTPMTVVLVIGILVATGLLAIHTTLAQQLVTRTTSSSDDQMLKDLAAKQQAIMAQLASIKLDQPAGLSSNAPAADTNSPTSSVPMTTSSSQSSTTSSSTSGTIHLNSADESALETLPDIGASKAQAILDYRNVHGGFKSIDELDNVKGIGTATIDKLRPHLTLD